MGNIKRIVLSGGGTGGHIYPALALLKQLKVKYPNVECLYIGSSKGLEAKIVKEANIPFQSVDIQGLRRTLTLESMKENIKTVSMMLTSIGRSKKILKEFRPDVVIGTGGYVCAPVLYAAAKLRIPTLIHEQNSVAGVTNKFLGRYVTKIATCFEEVTKDFGRYANKIELTGNPRGEEVVATPYDEEILSQYGLNKSLPTVLVFGGSRGAPAINRASIGAIEHFAGATYQVIIATGQQHYEDMKDSLEALPNNVKVVPYIHNMPILLRAIDLVVCRSGATTLAELTALGLPSILVPSPYVTANHQEYNALSLVNKGAAQMIKEAELTSETLWQMIDECVGNEATLTNMKDKSAKIGITDASQRLIKMLEDLV